MMSIPESNKQMAKFLGWKYDSERNIWLDGEIAYDELDFHLNFRNLLKVLFLIQRVKYRVFDNSAYATFTLYPSCFEITWAIRDLLNTSTPGVYRNQFRLDESPYDTVYFTIHQFICWYFATVPKCKIENHDFQIDGILQESEHRMFLEHMKNYYS